MTPALAIYGLGVLLALWRTDATWPIRIALALCWPIGPLAFVITVSILLAAALIAFPAVGAAMVVAAGLTWWVWS